MPDLHVPTIRFLNLLLKEKQLQLARAAHTADFATHNEEFQGLQNRLLLEIVYATVAEEEE